jgi:predicted esterase
VTELLALTEFRGLDENPTVKASSLQPSIKRLASRPVWIWIGDDDERVGTDHAIAFARKLSAVSKAEANPAKVELHVVPAKGHTVTPAAHDAAAEWIAAAMPGLR